MNASGILGELMRSGLGHGTGQRRLDGAMTRPGGLGDLVGSLLGGGSGQQRPGAASAVGGQGRSGGSLGDLVGGILGGGSGAGRPAGGAAHGGRSGGVGAMGDLAGGFLGQAGDAFRRNPQLAAGGIGALAGVLMGRGQPMGGALGGAALGLLSMIAMKALGSRGTSAPDTAAPPPAGAVAPPASPTAEDLAMLTLRSMIAAAKADGQIDQAELDAIMGKLDQGSLGPDDQRWVLAELRKPQDIDALVADVPDGETAVQVYAAALLTIEVDTPAEIHYMQSLAAKLQLPPSVIASVHEQLGLPTPSPGTAAPASPAPVGPRLNNPWQTT